MMNNKNYYLGIDTSNYTTSVALCDESGFLCEDHRKILTVKKGERGLRQSEALFQHINYLPECIEAIEIDPALIKAIGVSVTPRPQKDSYMPVFKAGFSMARSISRMINVPLHTFSHQENHIRAAIYGSDLNITEINYPFLATHFSGGTSEIILVKRNKFGFDCQIVGETLDLNAGQLVDRIGVALGYQFPAGKALEALALQSKDFELRLPSRVEGTNFHFSGQENKAKQYIIEQKSPADIAFALFKSIAKTLERSIRQAAKETNVKTVLFSGGVMANGIIKESLLSRFDGSGFDLFFSNPRYASDNAVGCAFLAKDIFE